MKKLDLINKNESDIDYKVITFNDGEPQISLVLDDATRKELFIYVIARIASPSDLFLLLQVDDILKRQGVQYELQLTYLMSMRMDRVMDFGRPYSLQVVANILNSMSFLSCEVREPHSYKTIDLIRNSYELATNVEDELGKLGVQLMNYQVILPDAGAATRYGALYPDALECEKHRDLATGAITSLGFKNTTLNTQERPYMVIDDLCDGGRTFIGIAQLIDKELPKQKKSIFVTHAVNKEGIINLSKHYDQVYITNSYKDWASEDLPSNVNVIKLTTNLEY